MCFLVPPLTGLNITYHCCFSLFLGRCYGLLTKGAYPNRNNNKYII